jgi:hypothetical protein
MKIFVLDTVPGADGTVKWADICHSKERFVFIRHAPRRDTSRWCSVERQRPFMLAMAGVGSAWVELSAHKTLEAALVRAVTYTI